MTIDNLQLTVSEVKALYRFLKAVIYLRSLSVFEDAYLQDDDKEVAMQKCYIRFYKEDFVMFGYSPKRYLEAAASN